MWTARVSFLTVRVKRKDLMRPQCRLYRNIVFNERSWIFILVTQMFFLGEEIRLLFYPTLLLWFHSRVFKTLCFSLFFCHVIFLSCSCHSFSSGNRLLHLLGRRNLSRSRHQRRRRRRGRRQRSLRTPQTCEIRCRNWRKKCNRWGATGRCHGIYGFLQSHLCWPESWLSITPRYKPNCQCQTPRRLLITPRYEPQLLMPDPSQRSRRLALLKASDSLAGEEMHVL